MKTLRAVPWWAWIGAFFALTLLFGETYVSVGNVTIDGESYGGFEIGTKPDGAVDTGAAPDGGTADRVPDSAKGATTD